ncbi:MAG TPA: diacylglycerol kinase family protein [Blastocatellia bacterium]|nr:diacylglycerol kinase family protein [Blastocatellia bacterium]
MIAQLPLIIVNPTSAAGKTGKDWPSLTSSIRTHFGPFAVQFTKGVGDAMTIAADEARNGRTLIIACGGDGTVSEVTNGIMEAGTDTELGIIPRGTGGDFRRSLKIPLHINEAARTLRNGITRRIDVGRASYLNASGKIERRYFINLASFGMSGHVITKSKEASGLLRGTTLSYLAATLQTTLTFDKPEVWLEVDDKAVRRIKIANVCIANGRYFGGGMKVAPDAKLNDGQFDVIAIGDMGRAEMLAKSYRLFSGTHIHDERVSSTRAAKVKAGAARDGVTVKVELDGEVVGELPAIFEIIHDGLNLRCPKRS